MPLHRKRSSTEERKPVPAHSQSAERLRRDREIRELGMTPAERLDLALDLSELCADLAAAGRKALGNP